MVMRNRHEGSDSPHWWDDLPPRMRSRFTLSRNEEHNSSYDNELPDRALPPQPTFSRGEVILDLSRFAILFILIVVVILLYMLLAMSYIHG